MHWRVPFIRDLSESCTSGLVANHEVKSMPRVNLLKGGQWQYPDGRLPGCELVTDESSSGRSFMGTYAY